jgi:hypothetical protein
MTDAEMLQALIHIKRHIISKPIKAFIQSKIETILRLQESEARQRASLYQVRYKMPLYDQKKCPSVDVVA